MSALTRLIPNTIRSLQNFSTIALSSATHNAENAAFMKPGGLFSVLTRSIIRVHFPRPSEKKRITRHGFKTRMSTPGGRKVLMNRILKGRFVYSH